MDIDFGRVVAGLHRGALAAAFRLNSANELDRIDEQVGSAGRNCDLHLFRSHNHAIGDHVNGS